jgi:hypothetical protein
MAGDESVNRRQGFKQMSAAGAAVLLAAAGLLPFAGGCIIIVPTIPQNIQGYGCRHVLLSDRGKPVETEGLLLMSSTYEGPLPPSDYVRCWKVESGEVTVPQASEVRYSDTAVGPLIGPPIGYIGMYLNTKWTHLYPLVPGNVPAGWPEYDTADDTVSQRGVKVHWVRLMTADATLECRYLDVILKIADYESLNADDKSARNQARQYATERLNALGPPPAGS